MFYIEQLYAWILKHALHEVVSGQTPHKLALASLYALQIFGSSDISYAEEMMRILPQSPDHEAEQLIVAIYCILASYQTIYDMPHMLHRRFRNSKICTHVLFGDALSYLVSLTLLSEAHRILLLIPSTKHRLEILELLDTELYYFQETCQVLQQFDTVPREALVQDYTRFQEVLLRNSVQSMKLLNSSTSSH